MANLSKLVVWSRKCPSDFPRNTSTTARDMSKADVRMVCRKRWGKDWYKVHPVIKKARMTWAAGGDAEGRLVIVHEGCDTYVA